MNRQKIFENKQYYLENMKIAFKNHYERGTDIWSEDCSLINAAYISAQSWLSQNKRLSSASLLLRKRASEFLPRNTPASACLWVALAA